jgi:hypothetical protein
MALELAQGGEHVRLVSVGLPGYGEPNDVERDLIVAGNAGHVYGV